VAGGAFSESSSSARDEARPVRPRKARSSGDAHGHGIPTVAVLGNPNAGKTTVFNRLTGLSQRVGNYPGVTVEKKEGFIHEDGRSLRLLDLPGTYSLAAHSPDEMLAVDVLLGHQPGEPRPDLVLDIVDASNLERNLYLLSQLQELGMPLVIALNMSDVAVRQGTAIDAARLSRQLGAPVVPTEGHRGAGVPELRRLLFELCFSARESPNAPPAAPALPPGLVNEVDRLLGEVGPRFAAARGRELHRFEVLRAVVDEGGYAEERFLEGVGDDLRPRLEAARRASDGALPLPSLEAQARYAWVKERVAGSVERLERPGRSWSERLDRLLTHRVLGLAIFGAMMLLVFQSIFTWAQPVMEAVDGAFAALGSWAGGLLPEGTLRSLIVDGVIAGAGSVVVFLPQILILFLFIGLLEDCGYMARAAFLMDKVMSKCGLSGKSFIPMLSGFACAVPGIMAARVIENRRDRIATILVTPLMSCSARLPVYAILIGSFIPDTRLAGGLLGLQAATLFALYVLGMVTAVAMAWLLKKTLLRGSAPPFVLELPGYKWPAPGTVLLRLYDRGKAFVVRAGTIILAISIIVWALAYFPRPEGIAAGYEAEREAVAAAGEAEAALEERLAELEREEAGEYLRQSFFGRMGRTVEPAFRPLGWDWKISMAALASFPAREVIVATLGTIYNLGSEEDESSQLLRERLRTSVREDTGEPVYSIPVALSIMVFFALCCQCGATVATIRRETNSWGWAWFTFGYMTVLAYLGALLTYQIGVRL
jgi:ferrous iron transport protein B